MRYRRVFCPEKLAIREVAIAVEASQVLELLGDGAGLRHEENTQDEESRLHLPKQAQDSPVLMDLTHRRAGSALRPSIRLRTPFAVNVPTQHISNPPLVVFYPPITRLGQTRGGGRGGLESHDEGCPPR